MLFSTMIAPLFADFATVRVALSTALRSAIAPAPRPWDFVGVLTQMKMMSALEIDSVTSVENVRFPVRPLSEIGFVDSGMDILASTVPSLAMRTTLRRPSS